MERMLMEYLVNSMWQVPLIAGAAWLVVRAGRPGPRVQHGVWVAALVLMVAMPLLSLRAVATESAVAPADAVVAMPQMESLAIPDVSPIAIQDNGSPGVAREPVRWLRMREMRLGAEATHRVAELYIAVMVFAMMRLLWSWVVARRMVAEATPAVLTEMESALLESCCAGLKVRRPRVLVSARTLSPLVVGVLRPTLLLPEGMECGESAERELEAVWWHELAHVRRRDYLANLVCRIWALPVAYHPATLAVERRVRQTREMVCDGMAAEQMQSPVRYARCLVGLAQRMQDGQAMAEQMGMFDEGVLEERVMELIGAKRTVRMRAMRMVSGVAMLLVVLCAAATFHVRPTMAQAETGALSADRVALPVAARVAAQEPMIARRSTVAMELAEALPKEQVVPAPLGGSGVEAQTAPATGRLQVLLLDGLNTSPEEQVSMKQNVLHYLDKTMVPVTRVAVFGLSDKLRRAQDFSSDVATLDAAVNNTIAGFDSQRSGLPDGITDEERQRMTLEALGQIPEYVAGVGGQKAMLFFTSGPAIHGAFGLEELRKTSQGLLAAAQIAVYAVDVRSLSLLPRGDAGTPKTYLQDGAPIASPEEKAEQPVPGALRRNIDYRPLIGTQSGASAVPDAPQAPTLPVAPTQPSPLPEPKVLVQPAPKAVVEPAPKVQPFPKAPIELKTPVVPKAPVAPKVLVQPPVPMGKLNLDGRERLWTQEEQLKFDAELKRLNSPEFKKQMEDAQRAFAKINSPEFRKQFEEAQRQAKEAVERMKLPEFNQQLAEAQSAMAKQQFAEAQMRVKEAAERMKAAEMNQQLAQAQRSVAKLKSPEFQKQFVEAERQAKEAIEKMNSPEFRKQIEEAQRQMKEAVEKMNSPEFRKQMQEMRGEPKQPDSTESH